MLSRRRWAIVALVSVSPVSGFGQDATKKFDVVSIRQIARPSVQDYSSGAFKAGLTVDPGRARLTGDVTTLIRVSYGLPPFRYFGIARRVGAPFPIFEVQATVPAGTLPTDVPEMVRAMLVERFGLIAHREVREQDVYRLGVASGGLKPKYVHPADSQAPDGRTLRPGGSKVVGTMERLADLLSVQMNREVVDETALGGRYEVEFAVEQPGLNPASLNAAKEAIAQSWKDGLERVGFKITPAKMKLDSVLVDHFSPTPSEN